MRVGLLGVAAVLEAVRDAILREGAIARSPTADIGCTNYVSWGAEETLFRQGMWF